MPRSKPAARVTVRGSEKAAVTGAGKPGPINPEQRIEVTVHLARRSERGSQARMRARSAELAPKRALLSRDELRETLGADPASIAKVEAFAAQHKLDVVNADVAERTVRLSGTGADLQAAFGVRLEKVSLRGALHRVRSGGITIPAELADVVTAVTGLDDRPLATPHFYLLGDKRPPASTGARKKRARAVLPRAAAPAGMKPVEIARLYEFPTDADGTGQCVAIIELGGGYRTQDLKAYFDGLHIKPPSVTAVSVLGGHNTPEGSPDSADGEVMLDIEVVGAIAPGARIAVYFAKNTDDGFLGALKAAVHDDVRKPSVVSISWGAPESAWTEQAMRAFDEACQDAAAVGVTVCAAAGDHGSADEDPASSRNNVDFPASSPFVLGCGGTRLVGSRGQIRSETVWNNGDGWATGGGVSGFFALPSYQKDAKVPKSANRGGKIGRGVPDIAGNADAETGYKIRVDGVDSVSGGTSAVAPLWAALIALVNQKKKQPVGFVNPLLYKLAPTAKALRDIISGDNGAYAAHEGWDACTGLGSPHGANLAKAL